MPGFTQRATVILHPSAFILQAMAAAYLATPLRRIAAAAIDFAVFLLLAFFAAAVTQVRLGLPDAQRN